MRVTGLQSEAGPGRSAESTNHPLVNDPQYDFRRMLKIPCLPALVVLAFTFWISARAPAWAHPGAASRSEPTAVTSSDNFHGSKAGAQIEVGGMPLCWCPPGRFQMGSPPTETGRRGDESQVEVTLSCGFWTGKFEVTQKQWKREMGAIPGEPIAGEGDDFPVYWVNFAEAEEFCRRLTVRARASGELPAQWEFRLPTEAQWEYACRAGTTTSFSFGEALTDRQANIGKPYNGKPDGAPGTAAAQVGSYPANAWGLHDMHGNEFEWCRDWYHPQLPGGIDPDLRETQGTPNRDGTYSRVRRGGAWMDRPSFCRSAFRLRYEPLRRADHIGFRVVAVETGGHSTTNH